MEVEQIIERMTGPALARAYNTLADVRRVRRVERFSCSKTGAIRLEASLRIVRETHDVEFNEDGTVVATLRGKAPVVAGGEGQSASSPRVDDRRVSPGLARLNARLGEAGAAALRDQVGGDGEAALRAVAAERPEASHPVAPVSQPASEPEAATPPLSAPTASSDGPPAPTPGESAPPPPPPRSVDERPAVETSAPAPAPRRAGRAPAVALADRIEVRVPGGTNPKRAAAAQRFAKYTTGMTVGEYVEAITPLCAGDARGQALRDVAWDAGKGWIALSGGGAS